MNLSHFKSDFIQLHPANSGLLKGLSENDKEFQLFKRGVFNYHPLDTPTLKMKLVFLNLPNSYKNYAKKHYESTCKGKYSDYFQSIMANQYFNKIKMIFTKQSTLYGIPNHFDAFYQSLVSLPFSNIISRTR